MTRTMTRTVTALAAAAALMAAQAPAFATDQGRNVKPVAWNSAGAPKVDNKVKFAIGFAIGAGIASAILSKNTHAHKSNDRQTHFIDTRVVDRRDSGYGYSGYGNSTGMCRVWRADCRKGFESACFKYDTRC